MSENPSVSASTCAYCKTSGHHISSCPNPKCKLSKLTVPVTAVPLLDSLSSPAALLAALRNPATLEITAALILKLLQSLERNSQLQSALIASLYAQLAGRPPSPQSSQTNSTSTSPSVSASAQAALPVESLSLHEQKSSPPSSPVKQDAATESKSSKATLLASAESKHHDGSKQSSTERSSQPSRDASQQTSERPDGTSTRPHHRKQSSNDSKRSLKHENKQPSSDSPRDSSRERSGRHHREHQRVSDRKSSSHRQHRQSRERDQSDNKRSASNERPTSPRSLRDGINGELQAAKLFDPHLDWDSIFAQIQRTREREKQEEASTRMSSREVRKLKESNHAHRAAQRVFSSPISISNQFSALQRSCDELIAEDNEKSASSESDRAHEHEDIDHDNDGFETVHHRHRNSDRHR